MAREKRVTLWPKDGPSIEVDEGDVARLVNKGWSEKPPAKASKKTTKSDAADPPPEGAEDKTEA